MNILVIIPARGGSKGIPRKNLRPLNGKPLISYSVANALSSHYKPDVYVSTDDEEIAFVAEKYGAKIHHRDASLAVDATTLDPVIYDAFQKISNHESKDYDLIITLQPTSPLLSRKSLDSAIEGMIGKPEIETTISVVNDTHLTWKKNDEGGYLPNYKARVNRQQLPQIFKETGSFFISRREVVQPLSRIGEKVDLFELPANEAIDIDNFEDWSVSEYLLRRKTILFCISGYSEIGLGHVYNCLLLASEILDHKVVFLVDKKSDLAHDKIKSYNYPVYIQQENESLIEAINALSPDVVINDRLDTEQAYVKSLKANNYQVINFEDLGAGAHEADLVINAIYPESVKLHNHYFGAQYFCAREEFFLHPEKEISKEVKNVLISFGGTDPNNLTQKVLDSIYEFCQSNSIQIVVVLGLGYGHNLNQEDYLGVEFYHNVKSISELMFQAGIAFSSAGRTVYELALLGTPSIIMGQNEREMTHLFANENNGFVHLGLGENVDNEFIQQTFVKLYNDQHLRQEMNQKMLKNNIKEGKKNVLKLIRELINN